VGCGVAFLDQATTGGKLIRSAVAGIVDPGPANIHFSTAIADRGYN
jgi:hypothetical protein